MEELVFVEQPRFDSFVHYEDVRAVTLMLGILQTRSFDRCRPEGPVRPPRDTSALQWRQCDAPVSEDIVGLHTRAGAREWSTSRYAMDGKYDHTVAASHSVCAGSLQYPAYAAVCHLH